MTALTDAAVFGDTIRSYRPIRVTRGAPDRGWLRAMEPGKVERHRPAMRRGEAMAFSDSFGLVLPLIAGSPP